MTDTPSSWKKFPDHDTPPDGSRSAVRCRLEGLRALCRSWAEAPVGALAACTAAVAFLSASAVSANVGVFLGDGHTLELVQVDSIQLVAEDVLIVPGRGRALYAGSVPLDWVDYYCQFELKNHSKETVNVKVGFPLTSQYSYGGSDTPVDEVAVVQAYRFIARDSGRTYHVGYQQEGGGYGSVFLWDMEFAPGESRTLYVSYGMPMSGRADSTRLSSAEFAWADWHLAVGLARVDSLGYVTSTGSSWAGPIEKARFRIATLQYEDYLSQRGLAERSDRFQLPKDAESLLTPGLWHREVAMLDADGRDCGAPVLTPEGVEWAFSPFEPGPHLKLEYFMTLLPRQPEAMRAHCLGLAEEYGLDCAVYKEIVLAWFGVVPKSEAAIAFVRQQLWYDPKEELVESALPAGALALLSAVDQAVAEASDSGL